MKIPLEYRKESQYPFDANIDWSIDKGWHGWGWEDETERWEITCSHWGLYYIQTDAGG